MGRVSAGSTFLKSPLVLRQYSATDCFHPKLLLTCSLFTTGFRRAHGTLEHQSLRKGPTKALARAESLRKKLVLAAGLAAVLNACLCGIGHFVINMKNKETKVRAGLLVIEGLLSLAAIVCIAVYWSLVIKIGDTRNAALSVEFVSNAS